MNTDIRMATSDQDILSCFPALQSLRPHLKIENLLPQVRRQQQQGFQLLMLEQNSGTDSEGSKVVPSVAGFRIAEYLVWGKVLYIDDLASLPNGQGKGYAGQLMDWMVRHAKEQGCSSIQLDTGFQRFDAHRFYLKRGFQLHCHHLALSLHSAYNR